MKTCFKCGQTKPLDNFYKHSQMADGHLNKCKECTRQDVRTNYQTNHDRYLAYEHQRAQDPTRRAQWYEQTRRQRARNPEKYKARQAVGGALRGGQLIKEACNICGSTERVEAHHHDYSKPLDVIWLCFKHHREIAHGQRCA